MKRTNILIAITCLVVPALLTAIWYYSGFPRQNLVNMPEFESIDIPYPPISTTVPLKAPPAKPNTTILIDLSHGNMISLSEIDPLIRSVESLGGAIATTSLEFDLTASLKNANAFITLSPLQGFSSNEISSLTAYVKRGGILVIATDPTRNMMVTDAMPMGTILSGVDVANLLLEPFDTSISDDYLYDMVINEGNFRNVIITEFDRHDLTQNVERLVIYGGHSVRTHDYPLVSSSTSTYSSATDMPGDFSPFALVKYGEGSVLVMGDLSLLTTQYVFSADNQVFVNNLAEYITDSKRVRTLEDFPVLFNNETVLVPSSDIELGGDLLSIISKLEKVVFTHSGELSVPTNASQTSNRIILTTFDPDAKTEKILSGLGIDLSPKQVEKPSATPEPDDEQLDIPDGMETPILPDDEITQEENVDFSAETDSRELEVKGPERIGLPGLGVIETKELGVVGLVQDGEQTTLIIATASGAAMKDFITEITINGLSSCLIRNNLAACSVYGTVLEPQG